MSISSTLSVLPSQTAPWLITSHSTRSTVAVQAVPTPSATSSSRCSATTPKATMQPWTTSCVSSMPPSMPTMSPRQLPSGRTPAMGVCSPSVASAALKTSMPSTPSTSPIISSTAQSPSRSSPSTPASHPTTPASSPHHRPQPPPPPLPQLNLALAKLTIAKALRRFDIAEFPATIRNLFSDSKESRTARDERTDAHRLALDLEAEVNSILDNIDMVINDYSTPNYCSPSAYNTPDDLIIMAP